MDETARARARATCLHLPAYNDPANSPSLVIARHGGHGLDGATELILHGIHGAGVGVHGANQRVVAEIVEMSAVLEPGAGGADVIGGAFAAHFDQHRRVDNVLAVKGSKWLQKLKTKNDKNDETMSNETRYDKHTRFFFFRT